MAQINGGDCATREKFSLVEKESLLLILSGQ